MIAEQRVVSRLFASGQYEIKNWSWNIDAKSVREKEFNDCFCLVYVQKGNLAKASYNVSAGRVAIEKPDFDYKLIAGEGQCMIINTGYSPHQYLLNVRLKHGEMLLHNKDLSIADITYSSGFSSPEYFSARFRKKYKMTPTEYRNECQRPRVFQ